MSYTLHDFHPGQPLDAKDLKTMDDMIVENEDSIQDICDMTDNDFIDSVMQFIHDKLTDHDNGLTVDVDTSTLSVRYNNMDLYVVDLPVSLANRIQCTNISLTAPAGGSVSVGSSAAVTATKTPANTTQRVLWKTSDTSIATITSGGIVTGVSTGTVTVTARCGSATASVSLSVTA